MSALLATVTGCAAACSECSLPASGWPYPLGRNCSAGPHARSRLRCRGDPSGSNPRYCRQAVRHQPATTIEIRHTHRSSLPHRASLAAHVPDARIQWREIGSVLVRNQQASFRFDTFVAVAAPCGRCAGGLRRLGGIQCSIPLRGNKASAGYIVRISRRQPCNGRRHDFRLKQVLWVRNTCRHPRCDCAAGQKNVGRDSCRLKGRCESRDAGFSSCLGHSIGDMTWIEHGIEAGRDEDDPPPSARNHVGVTSRIKLIEASVLISNNRLN